MKKGLLQLLAYDILFAAGGSLVTALVYSSSSSCTRIPVINSLFRSCEKYDGAYSLMKAGAMPFLKSS